MKPLEGRTVVELSRSMAASLSGMVLADEGAHVIKVPWIEGRPDPRDPAVVVWDRGKERLDIDPTSDDGRAQVLQAVATADGFIEDLGFGVAERHGYGHQTLRDQHPSLVHASITAFGEHGTLRHLPMDEWLVAAVAGRMATHTTGRPRPVFTPVPIASYGAAMLATQGLLAAWRERERTGVGQRLHTSLLHALVGYDMTSGYGNRSHRARAETGIFGVMPLCFMTAECAGGGHLQMAARLPHQIRAWFEVLGISEMLHEPEYASIPESFVSQASLDRLVALVKDRMATKTLEEWLEIFIEHGVGGDPFLTPTGFLASEQANATGRVLTRDVPGIGTSTEIGPLSVRREAPPADPAVPAVKPVAAADHSAGPLAGVTVLECASAWATPFGITLLREMGARVIKVEAPEGDMGRRNWTTDYVKETVGKESVVLDLKTTAGKEALHRLAERVDVFVHNFRPGVPERLEIGWEQLAARNPRLVYVYGSCYGSSGPWARRPGYHSTPNAIVGSGYLEAGRGNTPQNRTYADPAGAFGLATATLLGLAQRDRTGRGLYVETTMLASMAYTVSAWSARYPGKPPDPVVDNEQLGFNSLQRLYAAQEGWLLLSCTTAAHREQLASHFDETVADTIRAARPGSDDALAAMLAEQFATDTADRWVGRLLGSGVPAVRADATSLPTFMLEHPQMTANGLVIGDTLLDGTEFERSSGSVDFGAHHAPELHCEPLGGSTDRILHEIGYQDAEIEELWASGTTRPRSPATAASQA